MMDAGKLVVGRRRIAVRAVCRAKDEPLRLQGSLGSLFSLTPPTKKEGKETKKKKKFVSHR